MGNVYKDILKYLCQADAASWNIEFDDDRITVTNYFEDEQVVDIKLNDTANCEISASLLRQGLEKHQAKQLRRIKIRDLREAVRAKLTPDEREAVGLDRGDEFVGNEPDMQFTDGG